MFYIYKLKILKSEFGSFDFDQIVGALNLNLLDLHEIFMLRNYGFNLCQAHRC